jgi:hypothetical protein
MGDRDIDGTQESGSGPTAGEKMCWLLLFIAAMRLMVCFAEDMDTD